MNKADKPEKRPFESRLSLVFIGVFATVSVLILRLGYLQVKVGSQFIQESNINAYDTLTVAPSRGWIYDRNHYLLAADKPTFDVVFTNLNSSAQNPVAIADRLAVPFGMSAKTIVNAMQLKGYNPQVTILQNASTRSVSYVEEHATSLPGVTVIATPVRYYPYDALAGHVLGYIGAIPNTSSAAKQYANYPPNALVGLDGIEAQYETLLQGKPGTMRVEVNNQQVPMRDLGLYPAPVAGDNLVLNIDSHLQDVLQEAIKQQVQSLQTQGSSWVDSGVAVAMDPNTGAVLAMGSYPFYNPQWFVGGISQKHYNQYSQAALNQAVSGLFMPGSTEKPLTLMYALKQGVITPYTTVYDPGYLMVGNTRLNEWVPYGFGTVTLPEALEYSSDVYLYQVGLWLGHYPPANGNINAWMNGDRVKAFNGLASYAKQFGLTSLTGVDLPNEQTGYFHDNGYLSDLAYMAIGQDQAYTAVGLAQYVSAIANGGKRMKPEVLHEVLSPTGKVLQVIKPVMMNRIPVTQSNLNIIREGMLWVTTQRLGTAWSTFLGDPYSVAGKTGTAQTGVKGRDIALFIGWAPFNHPKIAVAVIVPGAGEGYLSSGPVARKIIDAYLSELAAKKPIAPTPIHVN